MSDNDYENLKNEINHLREEMNNQFQELRDWKNETDIGLEGIEGKGIWGAKQKFQYQNNKIEKLKDRLTIVENKLNQMIGYAAGSGTLAAIIFEVIIRIIGG